MNTYPENDNQFEEVTIESAERHEDGWEIKRTDGWSLFCPLHDGEPKAGSTLRVYGKGIGSSFRGLYIDGAKVFYRTEAEDADHRENELYGADAADWLARWDAGRSVFSIEMGGMGPGYEQCIQIVAAEVLRHLLATKPDASLWADKDVWRAARDDIDKALFANPMIDKLGLSGAQAGAGVSLGSRLYMDGPRKIMNTPEIKDRHIQVQRFFPGFEQAAEGSVSQTERSEGCTPHA